MSTTCPICQSAGGEPLFQKYSRQHTNPDGTRPIGYTVLWCSACLHVWDPKHGASMEYNYEASSITEKYNFARNHYELDGDKLLNAPFVADQYRARANSVLDFMPKDLSRKPRALDIGFGSGGMLFFFDSAGFDVFGVDTDPVAIDFINKNLPDAHLYQGEFEKVEFDNTYDVITMFHVLEHVERPIDVLRRCAELATRKGVLLVEVPHIYSQKAQADLTSWNMWAEGIHLHFFSATSLQTAMLKAGWVVGGVIAGARGEDVVRIVAYRRPFTRMRDKLAAMSEVPLP